MEATKTPSSSLTAPLMESERKISNLQVGVEGSLWESKFFEETKKQLGLAGPLIAVNMMLSFSQLISSMFVGHLGKLPLSGSSLAFSFASLTGFSVLMGMATALDTFCGQAFGAKQYHMLGIHLQRATFILLLVCIPISVILANSGPILIALGQNHLIAAEAERYALFLIPSLFGYSLLHCVIKFLQTQSIVFPMMITTAIATLLYIFSCWILVLKSGLGSSGAALANGIFYWTNVLSLAIYVKFSPSCVKTWTGFSKEALCDIPNFFKLAIPSAFMVCLTNWSFELTVFLAGLLPNPEIETSVLSICFNTAATIWMIPFGLSCAVRLVIFCFFPLPAHKDSIFLKRCTSCKNVSIVCGLNNNVTFLCSTRVSNELGAGHAQAARYAVLVVLFLAVTEGVLVGFVLVLLRNVWGHAYSNDMEVVSYLATMLPILAFSNFADGIECVLSGVVRGCGWQAVGACINLGSYYLVGMPSAIVLAFVLHIGGKGLWLGIVCALIVQMASLLTITMRTNWEIEAKRAAERVYKSTIPADSVS